MSAGDPRPLAFRVLQRFERYLARASPHGDPGVYDPACFEWIARLEASATEIRAEYRKLIARAEPIPPFHDISPEQLPITSDARWQTFVLYAYGVEARRNCELCPRTAAAARAVPGMRTAMFSILQPGKHLPPHRGPYKGLLRVHLGIDVPADADACWIEVGGTRLHWKEGKAIVFDDTFVHQAANDAATSRCVLFLDILRPLAPRADRLNRALLFLLQQSPFARRAKAVFSRWYREHGIAADVA